MKNKKTTKLGVGRMHLWAWEKLWERIEEDCHQKTLYMILLYKQNIFKIEKSYNHY